MTMHGSSIVAIIGRPNVGKSTLFNRIVGGRDAIVHDEPGVTRDRHYGAAEWNGRGFTVIDTGGFVPESEDVFEQAIREQAEIAIDESAVVVFVVDVTTGILPLDSEIAGILRKSGKKVFLVANKADSESREPASANFHALGLGDPIPLSALAGRRIGDFLDTVTTALGPQPESAGGDVPAIAIVGKPNVGKSTLVNSLLGTNRTIVTPIPGTTRDPVDSLLKRDGKEYLLIDTAGLRRKAKVKESIEFYSTLRTLRSIERCDVAVILADSGIGLDRQDLRVIDETVTRRRGTVLALNKWDLVPDAANAPAYEKRVKRLLKRNDFIPLVLISALTGKNIFRLVTMASKVRERMRARITTNRLNKHLLPLLARRPPSTSTGKEVKISYITQAATDPPVFAFFVNDPDAIKTEYRRFIEGLLREEYDLEGVPVTITFRKK
jgi:GTP-binding protein